MRTTKGKYILMSIVGVVTLAAFAAGARVYSGRDPRPAGAQVSEPKARRPQTVTDEMVRKAHRLIELLPEQPDGYNLLCVAFMQKARETGDFSYNARAESALGRSLAINPENYEAIKLRAALLLTYHRFGEALEVGRRLQRLRPLDPNVYGILTDALVELGEYEQARTAAEKMLSLKPDAASYARASYLRSLHGDAGEAIDLMREAVRLSRPSDPEGLAWCRVHLGEELLNAGKAEEAEREFADALSLMPDYHLALASQARARTMAGAFDSAIDLYGRAQARVPSPDVAVALGNLYASQGRMEEARRQYELVEFMERSGEAGAHMYSRQLALFWADRGEKLEDALAMAEGERARRADIYTSDALAWCLFKTGKVAEARTHINEALRLGTRDAQMHYHAGMIYGALGDRQRAIKHLTLALEINPSFNLLQSRIAREALRENETRAEGL